MTAPPPVKVLTKPILRVVSAAAGSDASIAADKPIRNLFMSPPPVSKSPRSERRRNEILHGARIDDDDALLEARGAALDHDLVGIFADAEQTGLAGRRRLIDRVVRVHRVHAA